MTFCHDNALPLDFVTRHFYTFDTPEEVPNLVFVHASRKQITDFKKKYNFLQFMMWEKSTGLKYIVVPDKQMESLSLIHI